MARGVPVEQRVEENAPGLTDPPFAVDERDLSSRAAPSSFATHSPSTSAVSSRVDPHDTPTLEAHAQATDDGASTSSGFVP